MTKKCKSNRQFIRNAEFQLQLGDYILSVLEQGAALNFVPHLFRNLEETILLSHDPEVTKLAMSKCVKFRAYLQDNKIEVPRFTLWRGDNKFVFQFLLIPTGRLACGRYVECRIPDFGIPPSFVHKFFAEMFIELMNAFSFPPLTEVSDKPLALEIEKAPVL